VNQVPAKEIIKEVQDSRETKDTFSELPESP